MDLGFIRWGKNLNQVDKVSDFIYDGVQYTINDDTTKYWDKYEDMLKDMYKVNHNAKHYTTWLTTKVLVGGEYSFWKDYVNLVAELNNGKYFSGGLVFKVHLK